jgi:hypothetical protein
VPQRLQMLLQTQLTLEVDLDLAACEYLFFCVQAQLTLEVDLDLAACESLFFVQTQLTMEVDLDLAACGESILRKCFRGFFVYCFFCFS